MGALIVLAAMFLAYFSVVGIAVLYILSLCLRAARLSSSFQQPVAVFLGTVMLSPVLAPAGTIAVVPVPLAVLLPFTRSAEDVEFLVRQWWFLVPSLLATAAVCSVIVWRALPSPSSQRSRAPRAA
jgi:hypothetical protein